MDLTIKPLRCFMAVTELQSFTRAADRMHITQPSLSIQINQLEKYLGVKLFDRSTRQVIVTAAGKALFDEAQRLIEDSDRLLTCARVLRSDLSNRLRLGAALYTFDIPERRSLIEGFMDAHPQIDMKIDSRPQLQGVSNLLSHNLDLALVIGIGVSDECYEDGGQAELTYPARLRRLVLRRERIGLRVPTDNPLAAFDEIPPSALAGHQVVVPSEDHGVPVVRPIIDLLVQNGVEPVIPPETTGMAIERYGSKFMLPAVTFGWFTRADDDCGATVRRPIAGFDLYTECALLSAKASQEGAVAKFIAFAERNHKQAYDRRDAR